MNIDSNYNFHNMKTQCVKNPVPSGQVYLTVAVDFDHVHDITLPLIYTELMME